MPYNNMGCWKKGRTEFVVAVSFVKGAGSTYGCVPKPVLDKLGNPKALRYTIQDDQVIVSGVEK